MMREIPFYSQEFILKKKKTYFKQCFYSDIPNRKYFIALFLKIKSVNIEILAMLCYNAEATSCVAMEISLIMTYDAIWFWFNSSPFFFF